MRILIVENNENDLIDTMVLLDNFSEQTDIDINFHVENNYTKILQIDSQFDIVMMDIELDNEENGIDLARKIRKQNKDIKIVFLSNYNRYLLDGYKAKADLYLLKPVPQDLFNSEMSELINDALYHDQGIYDERLSMTKIYFTDILYIEMLSRKINIHFVNGKIVQCYDTLMKWIEILKECPFSQPHRSFLVNMEHIIKFEKNNITLKNGEILPITRVFLDKFRADYIRYLNQRA